jgi:hypothetical protein
MKREVKPELLDELPASDGGAIQSRRDLQKVNALMRHARIIAGVVAGAFRDRPLRTIVELGAGDGTLLLQLAKRLTPRWKEVRVVLVDRLPLVSPQTESEFEELSWRVEFVDLDVFDWLQRPHPEQNDVTMANLFLHHFQACDLRRLLRHAADQTDLFLACEPRRTNFALGATGLLSLIGCNGVTIHDGRISVRAGFAEKELSALWPADNGWRLMERQAGWFTHCFVAQRS